VLGVALGDPAEKQPEWEYEIAFTQDNRQRPVIERETVKKKGGRKVLERPNSEDAADVERLRQSYIEQVNVNKEFRPLADFLRTVRHVHLVPQLVRESERYVGKGQDPFGSDFLEQIAIVPEKTRSSRLRKIGAARSQSFGFLAAATSESMFCRVAVRAVEAWLLADRDQIAAMLGISVRRHSRLGSMPPTCMCSKSAAF
jgi:hypothetical protein